MLDKKELNEKIEAFVSFSKEEKLNKEKNKLKEVEDLLKKSFIDGSFSTGDYKYFINYIGLKNLENKVIKTKNARYIYLFAIDVKEVNIEKLENEIIETKSARYIYLFAKDVKGSNIEKLENAIIETKNARYIYEFALYIKGANIEKLENAIIETKNARYIYEFALYIKGANIEKLENAIIETKNVEYIYLFARDIKGVNLYKFLNEIKRINLQNNFTDLEMRVERIAILIDLESIHKSVYAGAKKQILTELINERYEGNNEIILGIYFDYLNNPEATIEDLSKCDREYLDYMCSLEEEKSNDKKKVKKRKKRVN